MYADRIVLYKRLEKEFGSKLLIYVTGDRPGMAAQVGSDAIDYFIEQLDKIGVCEKISLFLYTRGGDTSAAWNIINLLRMYCDNLQVIVPHKAHSSGTIISLGANEIVMTKQATLGPIDPSIITPLNPEISNGVGTSKYPVSVEAVKGYLDYAKNELGINDPKILGDIFNKLSEKVHPLVLGQVYRSKTQIKRIAHTLLRNQVTEEDKVNKIIDFLCSESGGHDYTINRREAKDELGLNVSKVTDIQYGLIKQVMNDLGEELQLKKPFNPNLINGQYFCKRALLESVPGGSDYFITEGSITKMTLPDGRKAMQNEVYFEGWKHEDKKVLQFKSEEITEGEETIYERGKDYQI